MPRCNGVAPGTLSGRMYRQWTKVGHVGFLTQEDNVLIVRLRIRKCASGSLIATATARSSFPISLRQQFSMGYKAGTMPPEYTGGLGPEGVKALREFVEQGGTLVCLNRAVNLCDRTIQTSGARRCRQRV